MSERKDRLRRMATAGDVMAQKDLGVFLNARSNSSADYLEALEWLQKASKAGNFTGRVEYAEALLDVRNPAGKADLDRARALLQSVIDSPAATTSEVARALVALGENFMASKGPVLDSHLAENDWPKGCAMLKAAFEKSPTDASSWARCEPFLARQEGRAPDSERMRAIHEAAGGAGHTSAYVKLSWAYRIGDDGFPKDLTRAAHYMRLCADGEDADGYCAFTLAGMHAEGEGLPRDHEEAARRMHDAAAREFDLAMYWLGEMYAAGRGVPKDPVLAYVWLNLWMSRSGHDSKDRFTQAWLDRLETTLGAEQLREAQRLSREWKPGMLHWRASPETASARRQGTGFFVSADGHLVTNAHVVADCRTILAGRENKAGKLIASDRSNDLALIAVDLEVTSPPAIRTDSEVMLGETVTVYGYPLQKVLATSGNLVQGVISELSGRDNNGSQFQLTAPVQPGNSGGPVLDSKGSVIGVVVGKLDTIAVAKATGDVAQNVNFAIRLSPLVSLLTANGVPFDKPTWLTRSKSTETLVELARTFTVPITCK